GRQLLTNADRPRRTGAATQTPVSAVSVGRTRFEVSLPGATDGDVSAVDQSDQIIERGTANGQHIGAIKLVRAKVRVSTACLERPSRYRNDGIRIVDMV